MTPLKIVYEIKKQNGLFMQKNVYGVPNKINLNNRIGPVQQKDKKTVIRREQNRPKLIRAEDVQQIRTRITYKRETPNVSQIKRVITKPIPRPAMKQVNKGLSPKQALIEKRIHRDSLYNKFADKVRSLKNIGQGKVLVMMACGPSIKEAPLQLLVGNSKIDFMAINNPYGYYKDERCPKEHWGIWPSKFWCFCDNSQYKSNVEAWNSYTGMIINSSAVQGRHKNQIIVKCAGGSGFSKDLAVGYHIGRSSTFANMQSAYYMNYNKVYIFGVDMCKVGGKLHHYGKNTFVDDAKRLERFSAEARHYGYAAACLTELDRKRFVFCSSYNPWDFVNKFERLGQKEAPNKILEYIKTL